MVKPDRKHEIIKGMLRLKGTSLAKVARDLNVARTSVTVVSKGRRRSCRIESAIARAIGLEPQALWPDRYPARVRQRKEAAMPPQT